MNSIGYHTSQTTSKLLRKPWLRTLKTGGALCVSTVLMASVGAGSAWGQPYERLAPKDVYDTGIVSSSAEDEATLTSEEEAAAIAEDAQLDNVLLDSLSGLKFVDSADGLQAGLQVNGVEASDSLKPLNTSAFYEKVASRYLGEAFTLRKLNELNRDVVAFFRANDYPVVDVVVPEQDITDGTVQLVVFVGKLGNVTVEGNQYFSSELLSRQLKSPAGASVRGKSIRDDLNWINQNPFRRVNMVFKRGEATGETDLLLQVEDRRPVRFYVGYENSGTESTGIDRYIAGVNLGNVWGLDHQLNYQFTANHKTDRFMAHSGSYYIPLPWRHSLTFYGAVANSTAEIEADLLDAEGDSYTLGLRYAVPLASTKRLNHEVFAGYEYKYSSNEIFFFGIPLAPTRTEISQFNLGYSAGLRDNWGATSLNLTGYFSPGNMTGLNRDENFERVIFEGESQYMYARANIERTQRLPKDFSFLASVTGQVSNRNLLVSEQLGAGGYATVRGYDERVANAEEGIISRLELRTPSMGVITRIAGRPATDQIQFLGFWDYAALSRKNADETSTAPSSFSLSSAGVGLRYSLSNNASVRFDYGWQLRDSQFGDRGDGRGHVGVVLSF